jgi:formylglycine-generating enzyme required for sulfatase activity/predicted Ser/Thr protein kinase
VPLSPGQVLNNRYRVVKLLGQGGFGAVYRAWDVNLETARAMKENLDTSPEAQRQFKREAQILDKLSHANLPKVIDHFIIPGQGQYLVMEFVEGQDLKVMLERARGPLPEAQVLEWIDQICDALEYLHSQTPPVIHRDIKPANIKITPEGKAMLVDFGIAKVYSTSLRTTRGAQAVTPGYSPLEQYGQGRTDARSDIYALGATLYHLLTGVQPAASIDVASKSAAPSRPIQFINPAVSTRVSAAIERAMQIDWQARYASIAAFKTALAAPPGRVIVAPGGAPPAPRAATMSLSASMPPAAVPSERLAEESLAERAARIWAAFLEQPRLAWVGAAAGVLLLAIMVWFAAGFLGRLPQRRDDRALLADLPSPVPANLVDKHKVPMILVPAGEFEMGYAFGDEDERPVHTVYLDDFYLDQYEVTNARYAECVEARRCDPPEYDTSLLRRGFLFQNSYYENRLYNRFPVVYVRWYMADAYCRWREARLPTEAEWEKAARGGLEGALYPWGDAPPGCSLANNSDCVGDTSPVGAYPANAYGLYDMAGNVMEWVADWYSTDFYSESPDRNPGGPVTGEYRVARGGSFHHSGNEMRGSYRNGIDPGGVLYYVGFRCASSP